MSRLIEAIQSLLGLFGFKADQSTVYGLLGLVVLAGLIYMLKMSIGAVSIVAGWAKDQIDQKFWRSSGKVTWLLTPHPACCRLRLLRPAAGTAAGQGVA